MCVLEYSSFTIKIRSNVRFWACEAVEMKYVLFYFMTFIFASCVLLHGTIYWTDNQGSCRQQICSKASSILRTSTLLNPLENTNQFFVPSVRLGAHRQL